MTNAKGWELFREVLMENGEPFNLQKIGDSICTAKRETAAVPK